MLRQSHPTVPVAPRLIPQLISLEHKQPVKEDAGHAVFAERNVTSNVKGIRAGRANASQSHVWDGVQDVQSGCGTRRLLMNIKLESRNS